MTLPTLREFADAMMNNRFVVDGDGYPDYVNYDEDENTIEISFGGGEYSMIIDDVVSMSESNDFTVQSIPGRHMHEVKFLSNQGINPFNG